VLRQPSKLGVRSGPRKDLGIFFSDGASALTFKRSRDYRGAAPRIASGDSPIHKLNELVWQPDCDLLAHPNMVADCYHLYTDNWPDLSGGRGLV
jgi:hypothetical protein